MSVRLIFGRISWEYEEKNKVYEAKISITSVTVS